jgi:outer membrane protein assembly factor BamD (BamD/ComL family)
MTRTLKIATAILLCCSIASAADAIHGAPIKVVPLYLSPDNKSTKMGEVNRGREVIILENSRDWLRVEANLTEEKTISGWIPSKFIVLSSTPNGDKILFGEAIDSEDQASQAHGRHDAAQDAMRLYYAVAEYFPASPLAGEAMYRSADIRWQIEKADVMSRPSAKEQDAFLREGMEEKYMKEVIKKFPGTKWADIATFHLIDNKLCGDWQGSSKCPEKEAAIYEKYAADHPQSPKTAEALYDTAYRYAALIDIYKVEEQSKKSDQSRTKAMASAQKLVSQFPQTDWSARGQRLLYYIEHGIPSFGNSYE